ncbi:NAD-dependent epimerase/dehydratase family protein [Frigoriglobus tundricola]|uniref:ADP-L-glycero-D-manno-heptose-6-epimerase n=1 Tax=Frigoriglobus tundricola TaxID=2774151 RepID=A0A6M5YGW1_9BACT|nr:NAD-dependent epimerase/dehydratase family protein [Frigoriglobus tundricola]QJW93265.1 ADP-L-glycero-D-manno-heptose-6-epimerase [Frigoriglobus tundricola]
MKTEQNNGNYKTVDTCFVPKDYETLIHLAAITDPQTANEADVFRVNYAEAVEFFERALVAGVKRIVWASSASVYGDGPAPQTEGQTVRPLTAYAESKALLEVSAARLSAKYGVPMIGLRFSNVYGPGEAHKGKSASVVYQLVRQMRNGERPRLFWHGEQSRDWVSVHDVCRAITLATERGGSGVYNVGSGVATCFNNVVATINEQGRLDLTPDYIPNPFKGYQSYTKLDLTRSGAHLGYVPQVDLVNGIRELLTSEEINGK